MNWIMDWNNTTVLEFIELLQSEPTIWDPKKKSHKNRMAVNNAWERIKNAFSLQCCIEDLKRKRNSLMAAYREHLRKVKDSWPTGTSMNDAYQPTWFAFEPMHNFLGPVYEYQGTSKIEEHIAPMAKRSLSGESDTVTDSPQYGRETGNKRKKCTKGLLQVRAQMNEALSLVKDSLRKEVDENELFGQILVQKLKKLNEEERLMLTNEINNLVFKYEMQAASRLKEQSSLSHASTINLHDSTPSR